jgi:RNA polymerase sigma-70 factor, ECF subfamily
MTSTAPTHGDVAGEDSDQQVLGRVAQGELAGLEELYDRYRALAYGVALRVTGDPTIAEDCVQEAFIGAWRNAGRYDSARASVKTWLLSIVHHRAVDSLRRRRPTVELDDAQVAGAASLVLPDVWPEVSARLDGQQVRQALETLPSAQREAIELAYFGGLTQQEIGERTGAPLGTVKSRTRLGLVGLRRALQGGSEGSA